ncbi:MAG: sulfatase-like hydrolase/transferase [Gemmatimonadetes bacterium]|nr:sulfatase-like hydrolase/transferase [Gemmatimonadota bacterium]
MWSVRRLGILALLGLIACEGAPPAGRPVLLVTLDTVSADRVGAWGDVEARTSQLDRWARRGIAVRDAIAPTPMTLPSHATILSGLDPTRHGVRENGFYRFPDELRTLAERFDGPSAAFVGAYPLVARFGLAEGFDLYDDRCETSAGARPPERAAGEVLAAASDWLDRAPRNRNLLVWIHLYDAHYPYRPPAPFDRAAPDPYRGEIAALDSRLARFARRESVRDATWIVVGDHGESLGAHGEITHSLFVYDVTQRVPGLVCGPDIPPRLEETPRPLRDVAPTVLTALGLPAADLPGVPLQSSSSERAAWIESAHAFLLRGASPLFGIRERNWKYVLAPRPELYDLRHDPGETRNVVADHPEEARRLEDAIRDVLATAVPLEPVAGDPEVAERLRALGYVGDPRSPVSPLRDPKDLAESLAALWHGEQAWKDGDATRALPHLEEAIRLDPRNKEAHAYLMSVYASRGEWDRARVAGERALELPPPTVDAAIREGLAAIERATANRR